MDETWVEFKLDGTRVQLHMNKDEIIIKENHSLFEDTTKDFLVKTFTRNLEDTTNMYPDLVEGAKKQIEATSVILDGEAIGYDAKTGAFLPFQETMQRKRKHGVAEMAKEIPLKYFVFDILYLNGVSLLDKTLEERKEILNRIVIKGETIQVLNQTRVKNIEELYENFEDAKEKKLEGLIAKNPKGTYQAGARSYEWIKLKVADSKLLADSIDCVILGYYNGKGTRSQFGIGGLLLGIYDEKEEMFKTISKLGTGLTEEGLTTIKNLCDKEKITSPSKSVLMSKMFTPDVYVNPKIVIEVGADEITVSPSHSAGYALRFPRLLKIRTDKKATQATTLKEVQNMYKNQDKGTGQV
jgi:DNA ligase-1